MSVGQVVEKEPWRAWSPKSQPLQVLCWVAGCWGGCKVGGEGGVGWLGAGLLGVWVLGGCGAGVLGGCGAGWVLGGWVLCAIQSRSMGRSVPMFSTVTGSCVAVCGMKPQISALDRPQPTDSIRVVKVVVTCSKLSC